MFNVFQLHQLDIQDASLVSSMLTLGDVLVGWAIVKKV